MLLENYNRAPVTFVAGEGCELIDERGERYLDCIGGIAVCALGHAHPAVTAAVAEQAGKLVHVSNLFGHEPAATLAKQLAKRSGFERVFFCNSGTEANEAAFKLARKFAHRSGQPHCKTIVSCEGGFHGRTMGALAATANKVYHEGFDPLPGGFATIPFNDVAALDAALDENTAAFVVEPVQGENGVLPATREFLQAARDLCTERGVLLIFDEVQCGMGRVGPLFAFQHFGVQPDVVTLAKALANGLPIGAMLVKEAFANGLQPGDHGSTFGGSPIPCAAALAHLRIREEVNLETHTRAVSVRLFAGLRDLAQRYPSVYGLPRGLGLLAGLPVHAPYDAAAVVERARENSHVLLNKAGGNTIRLAPPLVMTAAEVERALQALDEAAAALVSSSHVDLGSVAV
jgi:predicted acetylornithine/succinylornithine family transaminase